MTLCIAALCEVEHEGAIWPGAVLSFDRRASYGDVGYLGSADHELKIATPTDRWCILLAGSIPDARRLIRAYTAFLPEHEAAIAGSDAESLLRQRLIECVAKWPTSVYKAFMLFRTTHT